MEFSARFNSLFRRVTVEYCSILKLNWSGIRFGNDQHHTNTYQRNADITDKQY